MWMVMTAADLDDMKADWLVSSEGQGAFTRMEHARYGTPTPAGELQILFSVHSTNALAFFTSHSLTT